MTLPVEEVIIGDIIIVRPGERIAMDGQVLEGHSTVNRNSITGESVPVEKRPGMKYMRGPLTNEVLEIVATKLVHDQHYFRIIEHGGRGPGTAGTCAAIHR